MPIDLPTPTPEIRFENGATISEAAVTIQQDGEWVEFHYTPRWCVDDLVGTVRCYIPKHATEGVTR